MNETVRPIEDLQEKYEGEWLAIRVHRYENNIPVEGEILYHSRDPDELVPQLRLHLLEMNEEVFLTFGGRRPPGNYAAV